jgi:hypothetical protein
VTDASAPTQPPGITYAMENGWGAITRGEDNLRRFRVLPTESAAAEYARATA